MKNNLNSTKRSSVHELLDQVLDEFEKINGNIEDIDQLQAKIELFDVSKVNNSFDNPFRSTEKGGQPLTPEQYHYINDWLSSNDMNGLDNINHNPEELQDAFNKAFNSIPKPNNVSHTCSLTSPYDNITKKGYFDIISSNNLKNIKGLINFYLSQYKPEDKEGKIKLLKIIIRDSNPYIHSPTQKICLKILADLSKIK